MAAKCFFDEIIECLDAQKDKHKTAFVLPETAREFFAEKPDATGPVQERQLRQPVPEQRRTSDIPVMKPPVAPPAGKVAVENLSLNELRAVALNCHLCKLHSKRNTVVFGEGNPRAELMFIGEGPGMEEDMQGRPFVGAAGQLLDKMILAMQYKREDVYIANIVKCRPPNNRNPEEDEAMQCLPYLKRQIELVSPKVIVLLGAVPLLRLLGKTGIMKCRGQWDEYNGIKVMPTFHPAFLLRSPEAKKDVWSDLQQVMQFLGKVYKKG
ncbi:MAG: uracil-DNA glycosylase [Victivallaceae bacterium]|jgi:DNA polymerase